MKQAVFDRGDLQFYLGLIEYDIKEQFSNFTEESPIIQYWDFAFESGAQELVSVAMAYF